ncbi:35067_t:CDS:2, partial [Racocetra persica]
ELLLKELEYIFYNITPPKLAKERLPKPNEAYNWITINNYEYQGNYNQLIAHNINNYNLEENHRQYTFDLIDQYTKNGKSTDNQVIATERETLEETGILIYQEKLIEIGH